MVKSCGTLIKTSAFDVEVVFVIYIVQEHQREMEGLLDNVRQLSKELRLQILTINSYIPPEYQEMIEQVFYYFYI